MYVWKYSGKGMPWINISHEHGFKNPQKKLSNPIGKCIKYILHTTKQGLFYGGKVGSTFEN